MANSVLYIENWESSEPIDGVPLSQDHALVAAPVNYQTLSPEIPLSSVHGLVSAAGILSAAAIPNIQFTQQHQLSATAELTPIQVGDGGLFQVHAFVAEPPESAVLVGRSAFILLQAGAVLPVILPTPAMRQFHRISTAEIPVLGSIFPAPSIKSLRPLRLGRHPLPGEKVVYAVQDDTVDLLVWRHLGATAKTVESALDANPGLSELGPILPIGMPVILPTTVDPAKSVRFIRLWD